MGCVQGNNVNVESGDDRQSVNKSAQPSSATKAASSSSSTTTTNNGGGGSKNSNTEAATGTHINNSSYTSNNASDEKERIAINVDIESYFVRNLKNVSKDERKDEMKINELKSKVDSIDMRDITRECVLVDNSGTSKVPEYAFCHVYEDNEDNYWSSTGTDPWWILYCGNGARLNGILVRYHTRFKADSFDVYTSDDKDGNGKWDKMVTRIAHHLYYEYLLVVDTKQSKCKKFIKIQFDGGSAGSVAVEYLQLLGKIGQFNEKDYLTQASTQAEAPTSSQNGAVTTAKTTTATTTSTATTTTANKSGTGSSGGGGVTQDITKSSKISYVSDSGTYSGYGIEYAYSPDYYWCSDGKHTDNCYVIFKVNDCGIDYINIQQDTSYYCSEIVIYTGSSEDANGNGWNEVAKANTDSSGKVTKFEVNGKNSSYIKIKFNGVSGCATMKQLQWFGSESGGSGGAGAGAGAAVASTPANNATTATNDSDITEKIKNGYVGNSGEYSGYNIDYAFSDDTWYWCSDGNHLDNCFVIFKSENVEITTMTLKSGTGYYAQTITILTSDDFDGNVSNQGKASWKEIDKKEKLGNGGTANFDLAKQNGKFIKIFFSDIASCATIQKLTVRGCQRGGASSASAADDLKDEIKGGDDDNGDVMVQTSASGKIDITSIVKIAGSTESSPGFDIRNMFKADNTYWVPSGTENLSVTFDCQGYEIDEIEIVFPEHNMACVDFSVGIADVTNDYAFDGNIVKSEKFQYTVARYTEELTKKIDLSSSNMYKSKYLPFMRLLFNDLRRKELGIQSLKIYGHKTSHEYKNDSADGNISLTLTKTGNSASKGKIDIVAASEPFDNKTVKENVFLADKNKHYMTYDAGQDSFMVFDLKDEYYSHISKISVSLLIKQECSTINFYTSDRYNNGDEKYLSNWKKCGTLTGLNYAYGLQDFNVDKGLLSRYLLISFVNPHTWLGVERVKFISLYDYDELDEDSFISLKDVLNRRRCDKDGKQWNDDIDSSFVSKYLNNLNDQRKDDLLHRYSELSMIEQTEGILTEKWINKMYEILAIPYVYLYCQYIAQAKLCSTIYEHNEMVRFANRILSKCENEIEPQLAKIKKSCKQAIEARMEALGNEYLYFKDVYENNKDLTSCIKEYRGEYCRQQRDYRYEIGVQGSKSFVDILLNDGEKLDDQMDDLKKKLNLETNIQQEYDNRNKKIFDIWCDSVSKNANILSGTEYTVEHYKNSLLWAFNWDNRSRHQKNEIWPKLVQHIKILADLLNKSLETRAINMHKFHLFTLSEVYEWVYGIEETDKISKRICGEICSALNIMRNGEKLDKSRKNYCKFLLCWQNPNYYVEMMITGKKLMKVLRKNLDIYYTNLEETRNNNKENSDYQSIIDLGYKDKMKVAHNGNKTVRTNLELLETTFNDWYVPEKAMFYPKDVTTIESKWKNELKLDFEDGFVDIRRDNAFSINESEKLIITSDDLIFTYLNCIAAKLDSSFQKQIHLAFAENRQNMKKQWPLNKNDSEYNNIGVHTTAVKSKSRQLIKMKTKYWSAKYPKCMAVTDIVRCGVVCENEEELCNMYNLLINSEKYFKNKVIRVKNAFDDIKKGNDSYGYRAILMNLAHGDNELLPYPEYQVACEVQLLLNDYWKVRSSMHLAYNVVRSETLNPYDIAQDRLPYYILAQDSCKFGTLDNEEEIQKKQQK